MDGSSLVKIKAVILDYGEVLSHQPTAEEWARMANVFEVDPGRFRPLWNRNRGDYDRGDLSLESYWSRLAEDAGVTLKPEQLKKLSQWDVEIKTGLLSNMPVDMIRYARQQFAWLKQFDHQTFSAEVRVIKPDAAIYQHSLDGLGVAPSEALFVDDRESNIDGARALGLSAIQFHSVAQLKDDLEKLGFPVLPVDSTTLSSVFRA